MAMEVGYIRTNGRSLPLQRQFALAFDRQTGARPNPLLGAPGGYYVDSTQTLVYNGLQSSLRKRFSNNYSFDVNYTLGKGVATQGGDLAAYYLAASETRRTSGTRSSTADRRQRYPSPRQRVVHLRSARPAGRSRAPQRRSRRLADLRNSLDGVRQRFDDLPAVGHHGEPAGCGAGS